MKRKILFWWHWLTNKDFRDWVYMHDIQDMNNRVRAEMEKMLEYQSRIIYQSKKP